MGVNLTVVQTTTGWSSSNIQGGDFGPGTRGMTTAQVTFPSPVTAGNHVMVFISGLLEYNQAQVVTRGPILAFTFGIPGGALPSRDYYVAVTYTNSLGIETFCDTPALVHIDAGNVLRLSSPNPNINVIPNAVSWNVYAGTTPTGLTLQQGGISPAAYWQEPNSGLTNTGGAPSAKVVRDNLLNTFTQFAWSDGGAGANQLGEEAMGCFYSFIANGGSQTIDITLGCFNPNPILDHLVDIDVIAVEFSQSLFPGASFNLQTSNVVKQGNGTGILDVELSDTSDLAHRITGWGNTVQAVGSALDIIPGVFGFDTFIATYSSVSPGTVTPSTPTLKFLSGDPAGAYTLAASVQSSPMSGQGLYLFVWFPSPVTPIDLACPVSGAATIGTAYSGTITAAGGTPPYTFVISGGSLPPGILLNASTGVISGTPTVTGPFPYTVLVTDSLGATGTISCVINVLPGPPPPASIPCSGVIPHPSTDVQFELRRVYATLVPHKRIPVRGGSGN